MPQEPSVPAPEPAGPSPAPSQRSDLGRSLKTAAYVAVAVVATIFLLRNSQSVEVDFVFTSVEVPLFLILLVTLLVGAVLALGAHGLRQRRKSRRSRPKSVQRPKGQPDQGPGSHPEAGQQ
jgi:uncharacterized integral membrane protein